MTYGRSIFLSGAALALVACGGAPTEEDSLTYHHDASPLIERHCAGCHQPGGIGPFSLKTYEDVKAHAGAVRAAVQSGSMPPWMPSDKGAPLKYDRSMSREHRELLLSWLDKGMTVGDPAAGRRDVGVAEVPPPPRADLTVGISEMYQPNMKKADDYHCFVSDPFAAAGDRTVDGDLYVVGGTVRPDNQAILHHVLVYEVPKELVASVHKADDDEAGPGYTCFGAPISAKMDASLLSKVQTILGWAPGGPGMRTPAGTAMRISAGSLLVTQMHYNLQNYKGVGDQTTAVLELLNEKPRRTAFTVPFANPRGLKIPAGNPDAVQIVSANLGLLESFIPALCAPEKLCDLDIWGNGPHMHTLGKRIETRLADGRVMLEIPRWNFHWQGGYAFREPLIATPSDTVELECHFDNSLENQPVIDGQRQTPKDVTWGEGTRDEMCLSYLMIAPRRP
jgi:hypothetical protein